VPRLGVLGGLLVVLAASALPLAWAGPSGPVSAAVATKASIHQVRISGSSITFSPTHQRGVPTAKFSVTLPSDATKLTYIHFELRGYTSAAQSSFRTLLVNNACSSEIACKKNGSTVDVTIPLRFSIDWWTAGLLHPGTYHPYVLVFTDSPSAGSASVELSTPTVAGRRRTRVKAFDAAPEPVHRGSKVTITGRLQRAKSCLDPEAKCGVADFGYWSNYDAKQVRVYFDPAGVRGPVYRKSLTTNGNGQFRGRFTVHASGRWYARFAGNAKQAARKSRKDGVAAT
jgi:hypothetical protein